MLYFCYVINGKGSVRLENNDICRLHFTFPKESRLEELFFLGEEELFHKPRDSRV